jgi:hypothetical protein
MIPCRTCGVFSPDCQHPECPVRREHPIPDSAPVIHFTPESAGFQPQDDAPPSTIRTVRRDGRWIRLEP